jgi:hypothetical protein
MGFLDDLMETTDKVMSTVMDVKKDVESFMPTVESGGFWKDLSRDPPEVGEKAVDHDKAKLRFPMKVCSLFHSVDLSQLLSELCISLLTSPLLLSSLCSAYFYSRRQNHRVLLVFLRHTGDPFAERDVRHIVHRLLSNPDRFTSSSLPLRIYLCTHCSTEDSEKWFTAVLSSAVSSSPSTDAFRNGPSPEEFLGQHLKLLPYYGIEIAREYGITALPVLGFLSWDNSTTTMDAYRKLAEEENIGSRSTGEGSDRWAGHGVVAVDNEGIVRWLWKAERPEQEADWEGAMKALGI